MVLCIPGSSVLFWGSYLVPGCAFPLLTLVVRMGNAGILRQSNGPWRIFETRVKPGGEVTLGALEGGISEAVVRRGIEAHTQSREAAVGAAVS